MKIKPLNEYKEPEYPPLRIVEKKVRASVLTGKKAATFAMAVAAAVSLTTCSARTQTTFENRTGESLSSMGKTAQTSARPTRETTDLTYAGGEITPEETATAGLVFVEETALAGDIVQTQETQITYDPGIAGTIIAPEETAVTTAG